MYDPIPDLAQLVNGMTDLARTAGDPGSHSLLLHTLLTGPCARLRGGLLLDEPGRVAVTTEAAIREALGQPVMPQVPDSPYRQPEASMFAWIPPASGPPALLRDLPVISAATAVTSYRKLTNHYQRIWPPDRYRAVRRRLLEMAGNLPGSEREQMPGWLLRVIREQEQ